MLPVCLPRAASLLTCSAAVVNGSYWQTFDMALQAEGFPAVQEAAVKAATEEQFHRAIDGKTREEAILPRVCWLVVKASALSNRINALLCLAKTFHFYQVQAVLEKVQVYQQG